MADLRELYQQIILDHSRNPRFFKKDLELPLHKSCYNPLCGDQIEIYCKTKNGIITDLSFTGKGCAISIASASLMAEALQNKEIQTAREIFLWYQSFVTDKPSTLCPHNVGKLKIMGSVRQFPMRVKCATCSWHALQGALDGAAGEVSTESSETISHG
tara:strand:- start:388 stop:861 length:474 start_codon:yes stop_codon:yes gene_type:complete